MPEEDGNSGACEEELELENKTCTSCKNCAMCCYLILSRYNLLTDAYHVIGLGYKFLLTLSVTQVLLLLFVYLADAFIQGDLQRLGCVNYASAAESLTITSHPKDGAQGS